jgi:putative addiction module killer protein
MGDYRPIGANLYELRLDFGPGYRIYFSIFSESDSKTVLILCAGDKSSQARDIERAKEYLLDAEQRYEGYNDGTI